MHSKFMSRMGARFGHANVGIGDSFTSEKINARETKQKIDEFLKRGGDVDLSRLGRIKAKWLRIKQGKIDPYHASLLRRDHAKEFAMFEAEAKKQNPRNN